jgi:hypothetical protein
MTAGQFMPDQLDIITGITGTSGQFILSRGALSTRCRLLSTSISLLKIANKRIIQQIEEILEITFYLSPACGSEKELTRQPAGIELTIYNAPIVI